MELGGETSESGVAQSGSQRDDRPQLSRKRERNSRTFAEDFRERERERDSSQDMT